MLPRSFLSASSLKNGLEDSPSIGTKRQRPSIDDIESLDVDSASDSSIDNDTDLSDIYQSYSEAYLHNDINTLLNQIEYKQSKQEKLMKKTLTLDTSIKKDTVKLAKLTRLMMLKQQQQHLSSSSLSPTPLGDQLKLPPRVARRRAEHQPEAPLFQHPTIPSVPKSNHPPTPSLPLSTPARRTQNSTPSGRLNAESSRTVRSNPSAHNSLAYKDTFDVVMRQKQNVIKDAFDRKARRLLCTKSDNITQQNDLEDLMVSCSLNGELQFWNGNDKQQIDKLDSAVIYKDTWVGDMCWTSPTTLTLIPSTRSGVENKDSAIVVDLTSVKRNSVKGDLQAMVAIPHQKGFESICAVDTGHRGGGAASKERISFVTAGADKTVYLWNLTRSSRDDSYEEATHRLDIKHTNKIPALCFDKTRNCLYTGGMDQRFFIFDLETSRVTSQLNLGACMYNIQANSANPNHLLITFGKQSNQFAIFDQREPHSSGLKLTFGSSDADKVDGHAKPDWHKGGNIVLFGSTTSPRLNFWDIRYANVSNGPSYSISLESGGNHRVLQSVFFPNRNTIASVTSGRSLFWMDYTLGSNCKPSTLL